MRLGTADALRLYLPNHHSFRICSTKIMYRKELSSLQMPIEDRNIFFKSLAELSVTGREKAERAISENVSHLFVTNHFINDSEISDEKAAGVYSQWVINVIKQRPQDMYCMMSQEGELLAFSIIKILSDIDNRFVLLELIGSLSKGKKIWS